MGTTASLAYFHPELALSVAILAVIFVDLAFTGRAGRRASEWPGNLALAGAGVALVLTLGLHPLGAIVVFLGIYPTPILDLQSPALVRLNDHVTQAAARTAGTERVAVAR